MTNKILVFYKSHSLFELMRKIIFVIVRFVHFRALNHFKALVYFNSKNIIVGKNVSLSGFCLKLNIAKNFRIYDDCKFELFENAILKVGSNVVFSYGVILCCRNKVTIGNDVQIGEYSSIRDSTHDYSELGVAMKYNPDISREIIIGNNVWIGRNCLIMPGSIIEDGVVVGANSIVKGTLKRDCIYGGNPIKLLKSRLTNN